MKKLITLFALALLVSTVGLAQKRGLGAKWLVHNYDLPAKDMNYFDELGRSEAGGIEIAWHDHFGRNVGYSVPLRVGTAQFPFANNTRNINKQGYWSLDALLRYSILRPDRVFVPYIQAGPGVHWNTRRKDFFPSLQMNGGLNIRLAEGVYLSAQTEYRLSTSEKKYPHGLVSGIGLTWGMGGAAVDTDGDGITDKKDKCPMVRGIALFAGCPDSDGDGFQDSADDCPNEAGIAAFKGCPDTDGDGIKNSDDKCPDVAGTAEFMGCPDTDGDGIADSDDKCPAEKGEKVNKGCPDRDGDSIIDMDDKCPTEKGSKATMGCPDGDGDGIADKDDKCPKEKGVRENNGCPAITDRDGDGIVDKDDACPDKKGDAKYNGCPDTDGDGVADNRDKCIDKPGPASNQGCPEMKVEEKKKLEFAMRAVQFETNQSRLLTSSTTVLDEIVAILKNYPEVKLRIEGHTDSQGNDAANQTLSENRARACMDYLASKGIDRSRLTSAGFGETRPVSDNATKAGRDLNRRVEFNTFY